MAGYLVPNISVISFPSSQSLSLGNNLYESKLPDRNVSAHGREQVLRSLSGIDRDAAYQKTAEAKYSSDNTFTRFLQLPIELHFKI